MQRYVRTNGCIWVMHTRVLGKDDLGKGHKEDHATPPYWATRRRPV